LNCKRRGLAGIRAKILAKMQKSKRKRRAFLQTKTCFYRTVQKTFSEESNARDKGDTRREWVDNILTDRRMQVVPMQ